MLGAYGAAVLYRKKDDDSLVILKEINMHDLTAAERQMALNEVSCKNCDLFIIEISLYEEEDLLSFNRTDVCFVFYVEDLTLAFVYLVYIC